jgi:hypothetical protein
MTMSRVLQIFFCLTLLLSQYAAQTHALSHLSHELAVAEHGEKNTPPLGHPIEKCVAFHALDGAISSNSAASGSICVATPPAAQFVATLPFPPRIVFDSRAPPALS